MGDKYIPPSDDDGDDAEVFQIFWETNNFQNISLKHFRILP